MGFHIKSMADKTTEPNNNTNNNANRLARISQKLSQIPRRNENPQKIEKTEEK